MNGSEKQIAWAEKIIEAKNAEVRRSTLPGANVVIDNDKWENVKQLINEASVWIELRNFPARVIVEWVDFAKDLPSLNDEKANIARIIKGTIVLNRFADCLHEKAKIELETINGTRGAEIWLTKSTEVIFKVINKRLQN